MSVKPLTTAIKCLELLELLAKQPDPMRLADVARLIGQSRATTYQRLFTLVTAGWLEVTETGLYRVSIRPLRIASGALEQAGLGERVVPILSALTKATRETSSLVLLEGDRVVIAQRVEARGVLRADLSIGTELSFKESASGQVWAAFGPPDHIDRVREQGVEMASKGQLEEVRQRGFAVGGGGYTLQGINVVAVPVLDSNERCVASVSLVGPEKRFNPDLVLRDLKEAADKIASLF
ncbi:MAG: IclR family transcriptional regulator [Pseudomonadota bacterium]